MPFDCFQKKFFEEKESASWGVMPIDGEVSSNVQQIALTAEQYEQLRMQADGNLNNMVLF